MATKFIGLDLGTHEVKAVLISSGLRSLQVLEVAVEATPVQHTGDDAIAAALELGVALLRRKGWNHYPVGVVLPGSAASFRVLKFPFADPRRITQAIAFEAEGQFPVPLENLEFDHVPLATGATGQALMVAVRRDLLDRVTAAFKVASIDLKLITVDAIATAQVLDQVVPEVPKIEGVEASRTPVALLLDIGHYTTDLVAIGAKGPLAARVLRRGGGHVTRALEEHYRLDHAAAEKAKRDSGFLPHRGLGDMSPAQLESGSLIARAIEPIVREVEHTRLWLRAEFGVEVTQIRLSGGGSQLRGLDAYLSEQLGLPAVRAAPRDNLGLRSFRGTDWTGTAAALGAAVGAARRPLIQLHKDISVQRGGGDGSWLIERMSTIGALGLAILALSAIDTYIKIGVMESERLAREDELAAASQKVFGEAMTSSAAIEARLGEVEGDDITSLIANRGAVDVLGAFVKATVPTGPKPAPVPVQAPVDPSVEGGGDAPAEPLAPAPAAPLPAVDPAGGVTWDDELQLASIEIRQKVITFRASATRTSAQDRLKARLMATVPCITGFPSARARDENNKKVFDPSLEHDCFFKSLEADS